MFTNLFNESTLDRFFSIEIYTLDPLSKNELDTYAAFVNYFETLIQIDKQSLIIGINFTYGWMPTIFNFKFYKYEDELNNAVELMNYVKSNYLLNKKELENLKFLFHNSVVGMSKLLHFINPKLYPIFDSRILQFVSNHSQQNQHNIGSVELYLEYMKFCNLIRQDDRFDHFKNEVHSYFKTEMTDFRSVDLVMYLFSKKNFIRIRN